MNTLSTAQTQVSAAVRRWLCAGLLVLLTLTLAPAASAALHVQGGIVGPALASNGSGGGCG